MRARTHRKPEAALRLTPRFIRAVEYARQAHPGTRKKTKVPYLAHLLGVASLVLGENGHVGFRVTEDMAIAALLHDAVEDAGGLPRLRDIEKNFGSDVARIVEGCSDSFVEDPDKKEDWEIRKKGYIARLWNEPKPTLLVSLADKLYNVRSIVEEHRSDGAKVWKKFHRGAGPQLWYYGEVLKVFEKRCPHWRIVAELRNAVEQLRRL